MPYSPADFRSMVVRRRDSCAKFKDNKPSRDRREALQFYRGDNLTLYGSSGDGLSTVVSRDTMEAVESMMPPLVRPFVAGEEVVSFGPIEKGDLQSTEQANTYINHVFRRHNNVLNVVQISLKDGMLYRLGIAKTVMEEVEEGPPEQYEGVTAEELASLYASGREIAGDIIQDEETGLYSCTVAPAMVKKYRVHIVAPDEFLYEERLASLNDASFLGHSKQVTIGDLIDMGVDEEKAKAIKSGRPENDEERDERFEQEDEPDDWKDDDLARPVWVDECYVRCDYSGNGVLEWRKVLLGGSTSTLLLDEPADGHPYSVWTPIPVPHKLVGLSIHDLTRDIQMNKTAVQRELNNAMYLANRPMREVVDGQVNIDDLLNPTVGGIVRVKQKGMVTSISTGGDAAFSAGLSMIEYQDGQREARTGVTRYNQGMDANSLNKTATGMNIIASASQQRQELVARQFGEFLLHIFERLLALVSQHATPEEVERVTGKPFVPWPTSYDTNVSVGLGTNNKDQIVGQLQALLSIQQQLVEAQGGVDGPLVTLTNIYETLQSLQAAMNIKGEYFTDPSDAQQAPQAEEDPANTENEIELQKEQIKNEGRKEVEHIKGQYALAKNQPQVVPFPMAPGAM